MRLWWQDCGYGSGGSDVSYSGSVEGVTGEDGSELR